MCSTTFDVSGTVNFRDAVPRHSDASALRPGVLFRSASVHAVSGTGIEHLHRLGVRTVIDLRSPAETSAFPSVFPAGDIGLVHVPLELMSNNESARTDLTLETLYKRMLVERATGLADAVQAIARAPAGGVVVHCTAGKDRTGLSVALALSAVGVPIEQILIDYALTEHHLRGAWTHTMVEQLTAAGVEVDARLLRILAASPSETLAEAMREQVFERWGNASSYLLAHGLTSHDLSALRDRLISSSPIESRVLSR